MASLNDLFRRNTAAISQRYPTLTNTLMNSTPDPHYRVALAKTEMPIPVYTAGDETIHINSPYDPEKEAERIAGAATNPGGSSTSYLVLGLDAGYLAKSLLKPDVELVIIVECEISYLRFLIESFDFTAQFSDPRLRLICSDSLDFASSTLLAEYLPLLHGDISVVPRSPRERMRDSFFSELRSRIPRVLRDTSIDISTQKKFGLRWMRNIVSNAEIASFAAKENYRVLSDYTGRKIHVTAAGPTLETSLDQLSSTTPGECIVATDTSLPSLIAAGIDPDFVVSVDCQAYSYHHFLSGIPGGTRLVLDLSSPPPLYRSGNAVIPVAGGHPFAGYVSRFFFPFIGIDTSGGNVTHAAVSFADRLAGREIVLHGADFSYPEGKLYANETYLYPHFRSSERRTSSLETMFGRMLLERSDLFHTRSDTGAVLYGTILLDSYRQKLEGLTPRLETPLTSPTVNRHPQAKEPSRIVQSQVKDKKTDLTQKTWASFCGEVLHDLDSLEIGIGAVNAIIDSLDTRKKLLLVSLMPISAHYLNLDERQRGGALLESGRIETRRLIDHSLSRSVDNPAIADE